MPHFYDSAPLWDPVQCPNTCPTASPQAVAPVTNARVIETSGAMYRKATVDGVFLLADTDAVVPERGWHRLKVYCLWFGHRIKSGKPVGILVKGESTKVHPNYSGKVVSNIAL